jgi:hypothetical protein
MVHAGASRLIESRVVHRLNPEADRWMGASVAGSIQRPRQEPEQIDYARYG